MAMSQISASKRRELDAARAPRCPVGDDHFGAGARQRRPRQLPRIGIVVHDQHRRAVQGDRDHVALDRLLAAVGFGLAAISTGRVPEDSRRARVRALDTPMVPPCSSTISCAIARPSPRPPCCRVIDPSAWLKRSNTWGRNAGVDAEAVVADGEHAVPGGFGQLHVDLPSGWRELHRVREQVPDGLTQPIGVAGHQLGRRRAGA